MRELDALIHTEVMGAVWDEGRCRMCGWPIVPEGQHGGCWKSNCAMRPWPGRRADDAPRYSTDVAAAWWVVEKLIAPRDGRYFTMTASVGAGGIDVGFISEIGRAYYSDDDGGPYYGLTRITFSAAICKAALAAVRGAKS